VRLRPRTALAVLALAFCAALLLPAGPARAHTELVHWEIVNGTGATPASLLLRFSEPIDAHFLTVGIIDREGVRLPSTTVTVDAQRKTDGHVDVAGLPTGTYSVAWWTRALDGDTSTGSFLMGIGTVVDLLALLPPVGARDPATQPATLISGTVWNAILHWLTYLASALMVGTAGFVLLTLSPWLGMLDSELMRRYRALAASGAGLFLFASLLMMVMQAGLVRYSLLQPVTSAAPTPLDPASLSHAPPYQAVAEILGGYAGQVWLGRMASAAVGLFIALGLSPAAPRPTLRWTAFLAASLGALFTVSLTAHAAVVPQAPWTTVADWSHLAVMSLWIGGIPPLLFALRSLPGRVVPALVGRFSTMALAAVIFLAATGLFAAFIHVRRPTLLLPTTYGRVLIAKLALFALLVGFGVLYRQVLIPRLQAEQEIGAWSRQHRRTSLERALPWELGVGCALLLCVALMASLGTSAAVWPAHQALGMARVEQTGKVTVILRAVPGRAGENALALDVTDRRSGPPTPPTLMTLTLGTTRVELVPVGTPMAGSTQRFAAPSLADLPAGSLEAAFRLARSGYADQTGAIRLNVPVPLP
jgi:copper transport protein